MMHPVHGGGAKGRKRGGGRAERVGGQQSYGLAESISVIRQLSGLVMQQQNHILMFVVISWFCCGLDM